MLISICIPCFKRLDDLRKTLPSRIAAAQRSPQVEIIVLVYDDDVEAVKWLVAEQNFPVFAYRYKSRFWNPTHAFNLCIKQALGEYFWLQGTDYLLEPDAISKARTQIEQGFDLLYERRHKGAILCRKQAFLDAGGYDERFNLYGKEDRELDLRLKRRGLRWGLLEDGCVHSIHTPDDQKVANYPERMSKYRMSRQMEAIYRENAENYVLEANAGRAWGRWN